MKKPQRYRLEFDDWLPKRPQKIKRERILVTVCIAAISKNIVPTDPGLMVIGATDRMLTGGDIEFEPKLANKIVHFSTAISGMFAGDFGLQTEIIRSVLPIVQDRIKAEPLTWWKVEDVAKLYSVFLKKVHLQRSENAILAPYGLDINTFISKQKDMHWELVKQLASKLAQFEAPSVQAIFCGHDLTGAHIYVVDNSANVICHDVVGFAAIGAGYWHADSQFMFAEHNPFKSFAETLLLTYSAKKHAEVAPGVGEDTDMFLIGPVLGSCVPNVGEHVLEKLEKTYQTNQKRKLQIDLRSQAELGKYIGETIKKSAAPNQQEPTSPSSTNEPPPPDEQSPPSDEKRD
ncbi:MAG TPA: hypothetical protein VGI03_04175 [Verrucomicrobiae bacterium]